MSILDNIQATLPTPRADLSPNAPRMIRLSIPVEKIGAVIGPGGKMIRSIIEDTKTTISVDNDGTVTIGSVSGEAAQMAVERIELLTKEAEVGGIYTGKVTRLMNFGAFVEILPGKDGLVHISELSEEHVASVEDVVSVGDEITVMVKEIDGMGRINLSRRALLVDGSGSDQGDDARRNTEQDRRPRQGGPPGPGSGRFGSQRQGGQGGGGRRPPYRGSSR